MIYYRLLLNFIILLKIIIVTKRKELHSKGKINIDNTPLTEKMKINILVY